MWFVLFPFFNIILPPCCFIGYFLLTGLQYFCQVTFCDPEAAKRACTNANPVIDGRKANCNLASLGRPVRLWPYGIISFHILRFLFVRNMSLHFICVKCSLCLWMDQVGWCYFILDSLCERVINSCLSFYIFLSCILSARETILFAFVFSLCLSGHQRPPSPMRSMQTPRGPYMGSPMYQPPGSYGYQQGVQYPPYRWFLVLHLMASYVKLCADFQIDNCNRCRLCQK